MPNIFRLLKEKTKSLRFYYLFKLFALIGSAQIIVQALGFIAGILVVRLLSPQEYAYYLITNSILGTMAVLADGGVGSGVMSQGAKVWSDKIKLGKVLATGIQLRKSFAIFSLIISTPILIYLMWNNGASITTIILIWLSIIPAFYAGIWDSLLVIVPQLQQNVIPLQKLQIKIILIRLFLTGFCLVLFPWAFVAIIASGLPRIYSNFILKKQNLQYINETNEIDIEVKSDIVKIVKRTMPGAIYYSLSGQITMTILSIFGNVTSIAQIGALGKFGMVLVLVSSVTGTLIIPRFARISIKDNVLIVRYFQILIGICSLMILVVGFTYLFSHQILWILGGDYQNLDFELVLCIIGACLGVTVDITSGLLNSRGWVFNPIIYITVNVLTIIIIALMLNITTLIGVLWMSIIMSIVLLILNVFMFIYFYLRNK